MLQRVLRWADFSSLAALVTPRASISTRMRLASFSESTRVNSWRESHPVSAQSARHASPASRERSPVICTCAFPKTFVHRRDAEDAEKMQKPKYRSCPQITQIFTDWEKGVWGKYD